MKKISLQWRITLMTVLLIGVTCIAMNLLLCSSGIYYMDSIADTLQGSDRILLDEEDTISFDPQVAAPDGELTILIDGAQGRFRTTNWYITAVVTALSGILAYFVSGRALKPLRSFASQTEKVQLNNLADIRINENVLPEFRHRGVARQLFKEFESDCKQNGIDQYYLIRAENPDADKFYHSFEKAELSRVPLLRKYLK